MPTEWRISYRRGLWVTVVVGVLCSLVLLVGGCRIDASRDRVRDDAATFAATSALRSQIDVLEGQIRDLAGLFVASHDVEQDEFLAFVRPMLRRSQARSLVYLRDLREADRAAFERRLGRPIRELTPDGKERVAAASPALHRRRPRHVRGGRSQPGRRRRRQRARAAGGGRAGRARGHARGDRLGRAGPQRRARDGHVRARQHRQRRARLRRGHVRPRASSSAPSGAPSRPTSPCASPAAPPSWARRERSRTTPSTRG